MTSDVGIRRLLWLGRLRKSQTPTRHFQSQQTGRKNVLSGKHNRNCRFIGRPTVDDSRWVDRCAGRTNSEAAVFSFKPTVEATLKLSAMDDNWPVWLALNTKYLSLPNFPIRYPRQ